MRKIQELSASNIQQSSFEIYEQALQASAKLVVANQPSGAKSISVELRPIKLQVRAALRRKHVARSTRASANS
jgi:hypothetical protein